MTADSWIRLLAPAPRTSELLVVEPMPPPEPAPSTPLLRGWATHYGESYQGGVLGCGTGYYDSNNPDILAVGPLRYAEWPCGTRLRVCGPAGCTTVTRSDACPGCGPSVLDLSEAGNRLVCGDPPYTCEVLYQVIEVPNPDAESRPPRP